MCKIGGEDGTCDKDGVCKKKNCLCDNGATICGTCSKVNVGKFCKDVNGVGVLEPSVKCPRCMKYDHKGRETGTGSHPNNMEICYDGAPSGTYTTYKVETCELNCSQAQINSSSPAAP